MARRFALAVLEMGGRCRSWRTIGIEEGLSAAPASNQAHCFLAAWTKRYRAGRSGCRSCEGRLRLGGRFPGLLFGWGEQGSLAEQGADAVEADFGGGVKPAEGAHAGEGAREDVLEKPGHKIQWFQPERGGLAGFAVAIGPADLAIGQEMNRAIGCGGFEDVAGQIAERIFTGTGGAAVHVPVTLPDFGWNLGVEAGMLCLQAGLEEGAAMSAQCFDGQEVVGPSRDPLPPVSGEAAAGNQIVDMRMIDQGARPGVEHTEHPQLGAQVFGVAGQILQGLSAAGKEQVQGDLLVRADEVAQWFRDGKGHQEVGRWQ